jgi:hypothetical protein
MFSADGEALSLGLQAVKKLSENSAARCFHRKKLFSDSWGRSRLLKKANQHKN